VPNEKLVPAPSLGRGLRYTRANRMKGKESEGGHRPGKISRVANPSERPRSDVRSAWNVVNHGGIRYRVSSPVPPRGISRQRRVPPTLETRTRAPGVRPSTSKHLTTSISVLFRPWCPFVAKIYSRYNSSASARSTRITTTLVFPAFALIPPLCIKRDFQRRENIFANLHADAHIRFLRIFLREKWGGL